MASGIECLLLVLTIQTTRSKPEGIRLEVLQTFRDTSCVAGLVSWLHSSRTVAALSNHRLQPSARGVIMGAPRLKRKR